MAYTVNKLAKISGVSVRTLHWYDEIHLLKPAYIQDNGYRFYEEEQLLLLQQILFFRELGFKLNDIQKMLQNNDFDKTNALEVHKAKLEESINRQKQLLRTIDKTIMRLKGEYIMQDKELYAGFDPAKQKEYEEYLVKSYGTVAEELIAESVKRTVHWGSEEWNAIKDEGNAIYKSMAECMDEGLGPRDPKIQALIHQHYKMKENFYDISKDLYIGLSQLYVEHDGFRKFFEVHNPKLPEFIAEGMRVYAKERL